MTSKYFNFPSLALGSILALSVVAGSIGLNWGLPSEERANIVLPAELRTDVFYEAMIKARTDIYKAAGGNPLGRIYDTSALTPIEKSMNIPPRGNILLASDDRTLANYIRPYLLRTNHTDEQITLNALALMNPGKLDFNPRLFQYGGVYIYSMGAYLQALKTLNVIRVEDIGYYLRNPQAMGKIFFYGRKINIIFTFVAIIFIFLGARELYGTNTALLSALIFSLAPAVIFQTHIMKPYVLSATFISISLYFSARILKHPEDMRNVILSGITAGLAAGSMMVYAAMLAVPLLACVLANRYF